MTTMKAVIYTRVSTAGQIDGSSLESQDTACRKFAKQHNISVAKTVQEVYSGGSLHERPALSALRDELRSGYYKHVICYAVDRLSRNIGHLMILLDEWERFGVTLHFVTETLDNSPEGKLLQSVRGYVAEVEREKIRERTMRGRRTNAVNGTLSFKKPLYGYHIDDEGKRVVADDEAKIVRQTFELICEGSSLNAVAARWNKQNVPTPSGSGHWWAHSIKSMVSNPAYIGRTALYRYKHEKKFVDGVERRNGSTLTKPEDWITVDGITPALVDEKTFERANDQVETNRYKKRRNVKYDFLLRGFIRCSTCGRSLTPKLSRNTKQYVCTSRQSFATNCRTKALNAPPAELAVWGYVIEIINGYDIAPPQHKTKKPAVDPVKAVEEQIRRCEQDMARIVDRSASADDRAWELFDRQLKKKADELRDLESRRDKLRKEQKQKPNTKPLKELQKLYKQRLHKLPFPERTKVLESLGLHCTWDGKLLDIHIYEE